MMNRGALIILFAAFMLTTSLNAQNRREQIKSYKIAYITERLDLTSVEAQNFWPIYNEFEEKLNAIRTEERELRKSIVMESMSEGDAKTLIDKMLDIEDRTLKVKSSYIQKLSSVLTFKKILLLKKTEDDFRRRMLEEFKSRRRDKRNSKN